MKLHSIGKLVLVGCFFVWIVSVGPSAWAGGRRGARRATRMRHPVGARRAVRPLVQVLGPMRIRVLRAGRTIFEGDLDARVQGAKTKSVSSFVVQGRPALRIVLSSTVGRVEVVLVRRSRKWTLVWSGRTGPLSADGDVIRILETGPSRILIYETKKGMKRCDKAAVRLFPRAFDTHSWRMRPVSFRSETKGLEVLQATAAPPKGQSWPAGLSPMRFLFASSQQGDGGRADSLDRPRGIDDADLSTMWAESRGGAGSGEFLDARSPAWPYALVGMVLVPGNASSPDAWAKDNRPASFVVSFGDGSRYLIKVPDHGPSGRFPPVYWVLFPRPIKARCATVTLLSAHPGTDSRAGGRTAFSELRFLSSLDLHGGLGRLAEDVAAGRVDRSLALAVVRGLGKASAPRIRTALGRSKGAGADFLAMAFLEVAPERLGEIADRVQRLSRPVRRRFALAVGRFGPEDLLDKLLSDRPNESLGWLALEAAWRVGRKREASSVAAKFLDRVSVGLGRRLAGLLIETEASLLRQSDLLGKQPSALRVWTLGQRVHAGSAPAGETARLLLPLWTKASTFPLRFRLLQALGWCLARSSGWDGRGTLRKQVAEFVSAEVHREQEELLRWAAVRAAGAKGLGLKVLEALLSDSAPRVRVSALRGLVRARWAGAGRALLRCTLQDPWGWVRLECSSMLGRVCPKGIGSVLASQVRRYGLADTVDLATVLAQCRYREAWPLLEGILAGYRKGPWKAARAARLLAGARRLEAVGSMSEALKYAASRARIHGPFERLSLDLLGALDDLADSARARRRQALWSAVAFALRRGSTPLIRRRAIEVMAKHCPSGWRKLVGAALGAGKSDRALRTLERACGGGLPKR